MAKTASQITWRKYIWKNRYLYLMCVPGLVFLIIFKYIPMYGIMMAFQDFNFKKGIFGSPFNNFANFKQLFGSGTIYRAFDDNLGFSAKYGYSAAGREVRCSAWKVTLYPVAGGTAGTTPINADEF